MSRRRLGGEQVTPCSAGSSPQVISRSVHHLADALSSIEDGIERRFLKPPLGETAGLERFGTAWKSWQVKRMCPQVRKTPRKSRR